MIFLRVQKRFFMEDGISTLFSTLWEVWKEMASALWAIVSKLLKLSLWILSGIIIVPCVYIAGSLYPMWQEWGDDM